MVGMTRCAPIRVPDNDPVWGRRGRTCFDFSRSCVGIAIPDCQITSVMEQVIIIITIFVIIIIITIIIIIILILIIIIIILDS